MDTRRIVDSCYANGMVPVEHDTLMEDVSIDFNADTTNRAFVDVLESFLKNLFSDVRREERTHTNVPTSTTTTSAENIADAEKKKINEGLTKRMLFWQALDRPPGSQGQSRYHGQAPMVHT